MACRHGSSLRLGARRARSNLRLCPSTSVDHSVSPDDRHPAAAVPVIIRPERFGLRTTRSRIRVFPDDPERRGWHPAPNVEHGAQVGRSSTRRPDAKAKSHSVRQTKAPPARRTSVRTPFCCPPRRTAMPTTTAASRFPLIPLLAWLQSGTSGRRQNRDDHVGQDLDERSVANRPSGETARTGEIRCRRLPLRAHAKAGSGGATPRSVVRHELGTGIGTGFTAPNRI